MTNIVEIPAAQRITTVPQVEAMVGHTFKALWDHMLCNVDSNLQLEVYQNVAVEDRTWLVRESWRRRNYIYKAMPINIRPATREQMLLFPHPSLIDPLKIAFTPSVEHGRADRQTVTTVGRFLAKYYPEQYDEVARNRLATEYKAYYGTDDVLWAETEDDLEWVYRHSATESCMSHGADHYPTGGIHPVRAYAGPDTRVAYMVREGRVMARTVVFEPRKLWVRIFGDAVLKTKLTTLGYTQGSLKGARLLRLPIPETDRIVCPYIDDCTGDAQSVRIEDDYLLVVDNGDDDRCNTRSEGYIRPSDAEDGDDDEDDENYFYCSSCDERTHNDDEHYAALEDGRYCEGCTESSYVYAYYMTSRQRLTSTWVHENDSRTFTHTFGIHNGSTSIDIHRDYVDSVLPELGIVRLSENYYADDDIADSNKVVELDDGEYILKTDAHHLPNGSWYHTDSLTELSDGVWVHDSDDLEGIVYIGSSKSFAYADDVDLDDPDVVAVTKWLFWMLCFLPEDTVIAVLNSQHGYSVVVHLRQVLTNIKFTHPILNAGPVQHNLFKEAA